jgi:hypothetical protein
MAGSFSMGISPHKILLLQVFIASYFIEKNNIKKVIPL